MRVIFLAEKPSALTLNGAYFGLIDLFERSAELDPDDGIYIEVSPMGEFLPVRFVFDQAFLMSPPPQIKLYFFKNAVAIYAYDFLRADQSLKVLWQERFQSTLLTLCLQGKLQLNVENETGFHMVPLPDVLEKSEASIWGEYYLLNGETAFALIGKKGDLHLISKGKILSEEKGVLKAEVPFHDALGHTAICEWENGELTSCKIRRAEEATDATFALALFESALIGADCTPFLSPELAEKAESLREYLGGYQSVVLTSERDKIGLVFQRKERVFDVRYFTVQTEKGKICNIIPASET